MSTISHHTIVTRYAKQITIGEKPLLERNFLQAGVVITVAIQLHALRLSDSQTNSRINNTLPLKKVSIAPQNVGLRTQ